MLDIQLGRRNLSPIQRIAIAEKYRRIYEKQAKENQLSGLKNQNDNVLPNLVKREPIDTTKKLAEVANVGKETYRMGKKILDSDNEEVKEKVLLPGIKTDMYDVHATHFRKLNNEENEIKDLIESNLRQRVLGNTNPVKLGRCFSFLNKWYGFQHGAKSFHGNQHIEVNEKIFNSPNHEPTTQKELAESYGISQHTMNNYMRMAEMIYWKPIFVNVELETQIL